MGFLAAMGIYVIYAMHTGRYSAPKGIIQEATLCVNWQQLALEKCVPIEQALSYQDDETYLDIDCGIVGTNATQLWSEFSDKPASRVYGGKHLSCRIVTEKGAFLLYFERNALSIIISTSDVVSIRFFYDRNAPMRYVTSMTLTEAIRNTVRANPDVLKKIQSIVAAIDEREEMLFETAGGAGGVVEE